MYDVFGKLLYGGNGTVRISCLKTGLMIYDT